MAFKYKSPNFQLLSTGVLPGVRNDELNSFAHDTHQRLKLLESKTQTEAINLSKQAPLAPPPPKSLISVNAQPQTGLFNVGITLPEFISPAVGGNPSRTPLYHHIQYSPKQDFSSNLTDLPKGHQVYWNVNQNPGSFLYFRKRDSYDGINWNDWVTLPGVQG